MNIFNRLALLFMKCDNFPKIAGNGLVLRSNNTVLTKCSVIQNVVHSLYEPVNGKKDNIPKI